MALRTVAEELARTRKAYLDVWLRMEALEAVYRIDRRKSEDAIHRLTQRIAALDGGRSNIP